MTDFRNRVRVGVTPGSLLRLLPMLALLPLAGCGIVFHAADRVDADGDGFFALGPDEDYTSEDGRILRDRLRDLNLDCNDGDDDIWPGAAELCDGFDNDCDGNLADFELDQDGDGFTPCGLEPGTTNFLGDDSRDCNDTGELAVFQSPGREEYCGYPLLNDLPAFGFDEARLNRGIDDNCDGLLFGQDEAGSIEQFEVDSDRDGHYRDCEADIITPAAPTPQPGDEKLEVDCVDTNSDIHPSVEIAACTNESIPASTDTYDSACRTPQDADYVSAFVTWYRDQDGDGDGNPNFIDETCQGEFPAGDNWRTTAPFAPDESTLAAGIDDCDDTNANKNTLDEDADGFHTCDAVVGDRNPGDFFNGQSFDADDTVYPGADEACDAKDNDLNGVTDDGFDADGDGSFTDPSGSPDGCLASEGGGYLLVDCDDSDPTKNQNDVDNDGTTSCDSPADCDDGNPSISATDADGDGATTCDATPDCDDSNAALNNLDADGDGWTTCQGDCLDDVTNSLAEFVNPAMQAQCDGYFDTNCDTVFDPLEVDDDGDGLTECDGDCNDADASLTATDSDGDGFSSCTGDCDDTEATAYPGAPALCDTITDNDCNGSPDLNQADFDGDGFDGCTADVDCDDNDPALNQADADSDGVTTCDGDCDDGDATASPLIDADGDGWSTCEVGTSPADCDDTDASLNYTDADGDGDPTCGTDCDDLDAVANGLDSDGDGANTCTGLIDCDDNDAALDPGNTEAAAAIPDGVDNDCDGVVDEGQLDAGDLAITEMLISAVGLPGASSYTDGQSEFIEIISTRSDVEIDLRGVVVTVANVAPDPSGTGTIIDTQVYTIPADPDPANAQPVPEVSGSITNATRVVLWRSGAVSGSDPAYPTSTGLNYVWQAPLLSDLGGTITLSHGGVALDEVTWYPSGCVSGCSGSSPVYDLDQDAGAADDRSPWRPGYSMGLESLSLGSASTNDQPSNWCEEQVAANTNLFGTPMDPPNASLRVCP
ncbi:MAG: hypothetical protein KDA24_02710 [Deltaproteobacteria bacterium]|nr:hypothetical protein [Deltaproteobacteria bacterium]